VLFAVKLWKSRLRCYISNQKLNLITEFGYVSTSETDLVVRQVSGHPEQPHQTNGESPYHLYLLSGSKDACKGLQYAARIQAFTLAATCPTLVNHAAGQLLLNHLYSTPLLDAASCQALKGC
jgi:hypothetical protein